MFEVGLYESGSVSMVINEIKTHLPSQFACHKKDKDSSLSDNQALVMVNWNLISLISSSSVLITTSEAENLVEIIKISLFQSILLLCQ